MNKYKAGDMVWLRVVSGSRVKCDACKVFYHYFALMQKTITSFNPSTKRPSYFLGHGYPSVYEDELFSSESEARLKYDILKDDNADRLCPDCRKEIPLNANKA